MDLPIERISAAIYIIRGQKVMLDSDLADLYGVLTKVLNQSVARNINRFPSDFAFQLTEDEWKNLRSQNVTLRNTTNLKSQNATLKEDENLKSQNAISSLEHGKHRKYSPWAFTEQGIAMLSGILRSPQAVEVNISIMRTFVKMRQLLATNEELARIVWEHDGQIAQLYEQVQRLIHWSDEELPKHPIGYIKPKDYKKDE